MSEKVKFTTTGAKPFFIEVEKNGERYKIEVSLGILSVEDTGELCPNGLPIYDLSAVLNMETLEGLKE